MALTPHGPPNSYSVVSTSACFVSSRRDWLLTFLAMLPFAWPLDSRLLDTSAEGVPSALPLVSGVLCTVDWRLERVRRDGVSTKPGCSVFLRRLSILLLQSCATCRGLGGSRVRGEAMVKATNLGVSPNWERVKVILDANEVRPTRTSYGCCSVEHRE